MTAELPSRAEEEERGEMEKTENRNYEAEWTSLLKEAKEIGLTPEQIRAFLTSKRNLSKV
jgi:DNA-binding transcriptional regulator YhcF (GntR family)